MALMDQARERSSEFQRPDISQVVPEGMEDAVARVSAAGQKLMYSPQMREELAAEVQRDAPVPKKLAEAVVGLMLTLDSQSRGGIPEAALFPAALDLLGEAVEVLQQAGQPVTMEDYREAARQIFALMGRKLGIPEDQLMGAAAKAAGVQIDGAAPAGGEAPPAAGGAAVEEEQAMQEGFR